MDSNCCSFWKTLKTFIVFSCWITAICGHNYLINPVSRGQQKYTQTGCRLGGEGNPTCAGPCDRTVSQINQGPISIQRGDTIQLNWYRHTHPGGFIRFAWSPTSESDSHASFDAHVDRIVCKEIGGCGPSDPSSPTSTTNGNDCGTTITVPLYVTNGAWTLQWAYFGGWYNAGDYYACVDYQITGGPTGVELAPVYQGGDVTFPNENVCLFYSTNALHLCIQEPCFTGNFPAGDQKGPALGFSGQATPATTGKPQPSTTKAATTHAVSTGRITTGQKPATTGIQQPVTTGRPQPITTGKLQPATTGNQQPATTGKQQPATTARQLPATTGSPPPATTGKQQPATTGRIQPSTTGKQSPATTGSVVPPSLDSNCAGLTTLSSSLASIVSIDTWGSTMRIVIELYVEEDILRNWAIDIIWPENASDTFVQSVYNAGSLQCQSDSPIRHSMIKPVASWSKNLVYGTTMTVEVVASNTNMSQDFIVANTKLLVYQV